MMSSHNYTRKSIQSPVTANIIKNIIAQGALPSAIPTNGPSEGSQMGKTRLRYNQNKFNGPQGLCQARIDKLPDDVLLVIFDFHLDGETLHGRRNADKWHTLVHVCRRWRTLVFASPRRLDLRLLCRKGRPVKAMLDIWPALPINIERTWGESGEAGLDNFITALAHRDRVQSISLTNVPSPQWEPLVAAMRVQFPELTELRFCHYLPVLPDSFLGGSAPRLQTLWLADVTFPAARTLILSARDLVSLKLDNISYIPPPSTVTCLSSLNKLESLSLGFRSHLTDPNLLDQPSPPRVVLPALIKLAFEGTSKYSEELVAHIDTPVLNQLHMTFFPDPVLDVRHLKEFIGRTKGLKPSEAAELRISFLSIYLNLQKPYGFVLGIKYRRLNWEASSVALLYGQVSHLFSLVERLDLQFIGLGRDARHGPMPKGIIESNQIPEIFRLFTATRSLYVSKNFTPLFAPALQALIGERVTEVLPNLRDIFLERSARSGLIQEVVQPFVDARRLSGQPVAVHHLEETPESGSMIGLGPPFFIPL